MEYCDIYKIYCKNADIIDCYIGSSLFARDRFYHHKSACINENNKAHNMPAYKFIRENGGIDNWTYEVLERVEKSQKRIREQYWIQELKPTLNERRAYTDEETAKEMRKEHEAPLKEEIARKKREHRQKPEIKEREREQAKAWREAHKEQHAELTRKWREENKEREREQKKAWLNANREKINERRRELYQQKKQQE